ncbi:MAG: hypothetical protein HOQ22_17290 [Nocardioidaceae bacterium]|nr:hypothetical protein [Nocardioidaceae bacterium]NUS52779.1 hypothetical protein [Nocardioidaceae bacterium]
MEPTDDVPPPVRAPHPRRWTHLPDPIPLERTVASSESGPHPEEKDDYWREVEWLLRVTGGF